MPQITAKWLVRGLDRKRLLITAAIAVFGIGAWLLARDNPRTVEETSWDSVVFPEMVESPSPDVIQESEPKPSQAVPVFELRADPGSGGMRVEMAANVPLYLDSETEPFPIQEVQVGEISRVSEPIWLEGGIEAVDGTVY